MADRREDDDDSEYGGSGRRPSRDAPSVIFKTEPDFLVRTLLAAVVALLSFLAFQSFTGNREVGEIRSDIQGQANEFRMYRESTDRRQDAMERRQDTLEQLFRQFILESR